MAHIVVMIITIGIAVINTNGIMAIMAATMVVNTMGDINTISLRSDEAHKARISSFTNILTNLIY